MRNLIIYISILLVLSNCGSLINPRYDNFSSEKKQNYKPLDIKDNYKDVNNDLTKSDTSFNDNIYGISVVELNKLLIKSNTKFQLVSFYAYWCKPCLESLPDIIGIGQDNANKISLYYITPDNWADINYSKKLLKKYKFNKPSFIIDLDTYGNEFKPWPRYQNFLNELNKYYKTQDLTTSLPTYLLIKNGNELVYSVEGKPNYTKIVELINE